MTRAVWPLNHGRPGVEVELLVPGSERGQRRLLLADTGAGTASAPFDLLLDEQDCLIAARQAGRLIRLSGAYSGEFRSYTIGIALPQLTFSAVLTAIGVERPPRGFDGIAGFRFLDRFSYGNFGRSAQFGLEANSSG